MGLRSTLLAKIGYEKKRYKHQLPYPLDALRNLSKGHPVSTIFDVGAHYGVVTGKLRKKFPQATVYSFEPLPASFVQLSAAHSHDRQVKCFPLALGEQVGVSQLHVNRSSATSSLLPTVQDVSKWVPMNLIETVETAEVNVTTIDAFCELDRVRHIDILKIDAQGGDLAVLRGASEMLTARRVRLILVEVNVVKMYDGQAGFHEISSYLSGFGFRLFDLFALSHSENGQLKWADAIYCQDV